MLIYKYSLVGVRFLSLVILLVATGCGSGAAPVAADEDQARKMLDQALAAWQKGETVEALKNGSPSITVSDPKWDRGDVLKKFEVDGGGKPSGAERTFTVKLWFADAKGKEVREQVVYRVGTDPIVTVFRSLF
ncbi:MAG: hypothetical protein P4L85_10995 [Paludisphaera borealis]|uniref:hypothetical protein n=1 Tax=Paludisphaera borealis TaxID=1387353 RepID=UPI00284E88AC|nr:hypothetical protein [Paludisphaera borealis]MDR3619865.1 hypothetical protein [Paludisphaera borealis]